MKKMLQVIAASFLLYGGKAPFGKKKTYIL